MGVPKFFLFLSRKYKDSNLILTKDSLNSNFKFTEKINELYLDANALIHPVSSRVYSENKELNISDRNYLEKLIIKATIEYINEIISYVSPDTLVYIAIDGVAPMAKIKHQRHRRFKSIITVKKYKNIAKKHNVLFPEPWNNSSITPGTKFMNEFTRIFSYYLHKESKKIPKKNIKYIFSSCYTPGEGEHKILQYIKKNPDENIKRCIYGLDADLLYLSLASQQKNIFLLREIVEFQNLKTNENFCFVNIDVFKKLIISSFLEDIYLDDVTNNSLKNSSTFKLSINDKNCIIRDYIFLGFLIGNDFLPNLPSINLDFGNELSGLEILHRIYCDIFIDNFMENGYFTFLVKNTSDGKLTLDYDFFLGIFDYITSEEIDYFCEIRTKKIFKPVYQGNSQYELEIFKLENLIMSIPNKLGTDFLTPQVCSDNNEKVRLFNNVKKNYYNYYEITDVNKTIEEYIKMLMWNLNYYMNDCVDYLEYYKYHKAPFSSDIYKYIKENKTKVIEIIKDYNTEKPNNKFIITPLMQLTMVLPIESSFLLPKTIRNVILKPEYSEYFPKNIELDYQGNIKKFWQVTPFLKLLEYEQSKEIIEKSRLTSKEMELNTFREEINIIL